MRQLRGYLAYCGLDQQLEKLADEEHWDLCEEKLLEAINPDMRDCHQIVLFRNGELIIMVDQPHWAAWLRARQTRILNELKESGARVRSLRIATTPSLIKPGKRPISKLTPPPTNAADIVDNAAESIADPDLKLSLQRLGKKLREKS
ncbi:MAG: hypothetical protein ACI8P9_004617 [Parasphingorhabdus sp.]|jgi:hypothetical protein